MVGDERVKQTKGEEMQVGRMVGNTRVGRIGEGRRCEGR